MMMNLKLWHLVEYLLLENSFHQCRLPSVLQAFMARLHLILRSGSRPKPSQTLLETLPNRTQIAQDAPKRLKRCPRVLKGRPRGAQETPKSAQEAPKNGQDTSRRRPNPPKTEPGEFPKLEFEGFGGLSEDCVRDELFRKRFFLIF